MTKMDVNPKKIQSVENQLGWDYYDLRGKCLPRARSNSGGAG